jgi:general secretion pathway protein D
VFKKNLFRYSSFVAVAVYFLAGVSYSNAGMHAYASSGNTIFAASSVNRNGIETIPGSIVVAQIDTPGGTPASTTVNPNQGPGAPSTVPAFQAPGAPGGSPQPGATPMPGATPQVPAVTAPVPSRLAPAGKARVSPSAGGSSFFFDDADVFEVIQTVFGEVLRVNYIIDSQVKGRVNFRTTTPIPRDNILPIMEIILRLNGIAVVEESGLYRIIPIANIAKEPAPIRFGNNPDSVELKGTAILQVVPLTFVNSTDMANILTPLLTQGGAIHDIVKRNMLIIADSDSNVRRLLQVISMFDIDTYKDASRSKIYVYPLQNSKSEHVAKILQQVLLGGSASSSSSSGSSVKTTTGGGPQTGAQNVPRPGPTGTMTTSGSSTGEQLVAPSTKIISDEVSNTLVIFASPADYSVILGAIKQIDSVPRQVMIEAVVASVTLTDNLTYGMRWNLNVNATQLKIKPFTQPITLGGPLGFQGLSGLAAGAFGYAATDPTGNVRIAIEADVTAGKAKILSAPHLLVADNREARIQVGSEIPIATSTTSSPLTTTGTQVTNTTTSTIQYKDVGTILKIKPQINDSGLISLELSQEVSSASTQNILGTDQFVISKNEVTTNLVAQDGETIVIGGLVNETTSFSRSGIPVLSKLPVIGALFGQTGDESTRQELLILLTPRVIRNQNEADKMTKDYYELFKNVGKEINLDKHKKTTPMSNLGDPTPPQTNGNANTPASPPKP